MRPWSTAIHIPTDAGSLWFKASGPGASYEGPLLEVLRRFEIGHVLMPMALHPERPWLLFEDGGPTFRAARPDGTGDHDLIAWERILRTYAGVQRSVEREATVSAMLLAGTPDGRPDALLPGLERLVADDRIWRLVQPDERAPAAAARARLSGLVRERRLTDMVATLEALDIPPTIQHDDLHGGNIFVNQDRVAFFDWGDAAVAHPFSTLTATFNSIAHHTGRGLDDPVFVRLRDVYTEAWTDVASRARQIEAAGLARGFGGIGKALAWERALADLEADEMDDHGDAVAGWLMDFAAWLNADPTGWISR